MDMMTTHPTKDRIVMLTRWGIAMVFTHHRFLYARPESMAGS
jgi:hypothetical protein